MTTDLQGRPVISGACPLLATDAAGSKRELRHVEPASCSGPTIALTLRKVGRDALVETLAERRSRRPGVDVAACRGRKSAQPGSKTSLLRCERRTCHDANDRAGAPLMSSGEPLEKPQKPLVGLGRNRSVNVVPALETEPVYQVPERLFAVPTHL
jgi:hypothetical protein